MKYFFSTAVFLFLSCCIVGVGVGQDVPVRVKKSDHKKAAAASKKQKSDSTFAKITDDPALPRVLLIGDSISIGYTVPTREALAGRANVHRIPTNGGNTIRGMQYLKRWLGKEKWDVIHFNWGLHDLKHMKNDKPDITGPRALSPEEYGKNLEKLVEQLEKTGATLIWATTTPVPKGSLARIKGDELIYNGVAAKIMARHGVKVNDLHGYIMPKLAEVQMPKNVHFKDAGYKSLGRKVADEISKALKERKQSK